MKRNTTIKTLAGLLIGLSLAACSQEQDSLQINTTSNATPLKALHENEVEEVVTLSSSAYLVQQEEQLRAFPYTVTATDYAHHWYNTITRRTETEQMKLHRPTLDVASLAERVDVVAVLRNTQWPTSRASLIFPMTWNKSNNTFTVRQEVTLPTGAGTSKWGTNGWRMLLFAGGTLDPESGVYSSQKSTYPLPSVAHLGGTTNLNTIFVSKSSGNASDPWLPVTVSTSGTTTTFSVPNVEMQPQGTLLMLQAKNETPTPPRGDLNYVNIYGFTVKTNAASLSATYSLLNLTTDSVPAYRGSEGGFSARFIKDGAKPDILKPRSSDQLHPSRFSKVQMLYVFPMALPKEQVPSTAIGVSFSAYIATSNSTTGVVTRTAVSTSALANGNTYPVQINVSSGKASAVEEQMLSLKHPIEMLLVDDSNTAKISGQGRFSSTADKDVYKEGRNYYMPTEAELRILVPGMHGGLPPGGQLTNPIIRFGERFEAAVSGMQEPIQVFENTRPYYGDYISPGGNVSYGMRFLNNQGIQQGEWRSAYRYERIYRDGKPVLKIIVRHLGNNRSELDVRSIANETWWNTTQNGVIATYERYIPQGQYWSSSGMPAMPRKKLVMRIFYNEPNEMGDRGNGVFVTDYNAFRQWAEVEANIDTKTILFTRQQKVTL